ncbi:MAG: PQQ-binding-like beta-propeller repeat protein [Micropruina sp.]|uniref:outer membrane protein assembly factor BamB family protein n=1 Tax=Micropruina sp. TaxID=2737536 RepID=UPI0039E5260B
MGTVLKMVGLYLLILFLIAVVGGLIDAGSTRSDPTPTRTPAPRVPTLDAVWSVQPDSLRPDLGGGAELITPLDGSFDDNRLVVAGATWVVLSGDSADRRVAVHGLDAATGRPLWRNDLPDGMCAGRPLDGAVLCAASTATDPATGLGTRWRISLFDPATGRELRGTDFDGWLTLLRADGDRVMLVEQRQPAPHAVLTGLDATLKQRWRIDLRDQQEHVGLFSNDRIFYRKLPIPDGPALDRPRIRKVANGLTALWSGQSTAFVDLRRGVLVGLPRCSRLVDDGQRLWCNQGNRATAFSYRLERLHRTADDTRLAFPYRDPRAGDVTDPVFTEAGGRAVRVDPASGRTLGELAETRNGSAFGLKLSPRADFVDGVTLLSDSSLTIAVDARTGASHWQRQKPDAMDEVWKWGDRLLLTGSYVRLLDRSTGRELVAYRQRHGLYTAVVGDTLVGIGPDEVARLTRP